MTIQHRNIPEGLIHEPKGVTIASQGSVYTSNGTGSGSWKFPQLVGQGSSAEDSIPLSDGVGGVSWVERSLFEQGRTIDRVLTAFSLSTVQGPSSVDSPYNVEFGSAQGSSSDPVQITSGGLITINQSGLYLIKTSLQYGRESNSGVSVMHFRVTVDGSQAGRSIMTKINNSNIVIPYSDESWVYFPEGSEIQYQIVRDSSGNNSGSLIGSNPSLPGWDFAPNAYIRIERFA